MLAQRISSINSISALCEKTGADIDEVSEAVGLDKRIGNKFLKSSIGFGGSCFKKDILNLVYIARSYGLDDVAAYWESVVEINSYQTLRLANKVLEYVKSDDELSITVLGWAFKKDTNDSRESASIYLTNKLLSEEIKINIYDPMVESSKIIDDLQNILIENSFNDSKIKKILKRVKIFDDMYNSLINASGVVICTEWDEFYEANWNRIFGKMKSPKYVFDGRNLLNISKLKQIGFKTYSIGKS